MKAFVLVSAISLSFGADTASLLQHKQIAQHKQFGQSKRQCSDIGLKGKKVEKIEKRKKKCLKKGCTIVNATLCRDSTAEECPYGSKCQTKDLMSGYCQKGDDPICGPDKCGGPVCRRFCEYGNKLDEIGCPTCECKDPPHNCYSREVWSPEKTDWCCKNMQLGCPTCDRFVCLRFCPKGNVIVNGCPTCQCIGDSCDKPDRDFCPKGICPTLEPGCERGKIVYEWNQDSKCCEKDLCPVVCEDEYDCTTKEKWTPDKTKWCCKNKNLGCPKPCPQIRCEKACSGKNVIDDNGCPTCDCIGEICNEEKGPCPVAGCIQPPKGCTSGSTELVWKEPGLFGDVAPASICCAKDLCPMSCEGKCTQKDNTIFGSGCPDPRLVRCAGPKSPNCAFKNPPDYEWDDSNKCCPKLCQYECPEGEICQEGCDQRL